MTQHLFYRNLESHPQTITATQFLPPRKLRRSKNGTDTLERQIIDQKPDSMKKKALEYEEESSEEENDSSDNADEESASGEEEEGSDDQGADSEGEERSNGQPEQTKRSTVGLSSSSEQCTFDLRNLVAVNSHQLDANLLYAPKKKSKQPKENNTTIPLAANDIQVDEDELLKKAQDGCTQLISALWQLPMESSDAGPMVTLPKYQEIKIPRALPPPPPKKETKWEKFAKERGIGINQEKRSRKVWDEATGEWMYRHGYQKANNDAMEWPIMEVKGNDDPFADPWEKLRDAKRGRVDKNLENRMRNQEKAGQLPKGTTTRVMKNLASGRKAGKEGGNKDRDSVLATGIPVDLQANKASAPIASKKRGKESTMAALIATQRSTASLGKFDKVREGEPERKKAQAKKRKFEGGTDKNVASTEAERGMKVLNAVMNGGGAAREKAKRNGSLARGETAYDYDFDDGLGASSFRKKKGRAGMGKLKKITKKRVK